MSEELTTQIVVIPLFLPAKEGEGIMTDLDEVPQRLTTSQRDDNGGGQEDSNEGGQEDAERGGQVSPDDGDERTKKPKSKRRRTDVDTRTERARKGGKQITKMVEKYITATGSKGFFKSEYMGKGSKQQYQAGTPWEGMVETTAPTPVEIDFSCVKELVREGIQDGLKTILPQGQEPSGSNMGRTLSPQKHVTSDKCWSCSNKNFVLNSLNYTTQWIGCNIDKCENWVHDVCLSMPGLKPADVDQLQDVFCPLHLVAGLTKKKVKSKLVTSTQATSKTRK